MLNGNRKSIMFGLKNGVIIKWNLYHNDDEQQQILNGECQAKTEPFFSFYSKVSQIKINKNNKYIHREYFEGHSNEICFIGFINKTSNIMISIDIFGQLCIWNYSKKYWKDFGYFIPKYRYKIDCDSFLIQPLK